MSVRRLAEPAVQPPSFAFDRAKSTEAKTWIRKYPEGRQQSAVIPLLMLAQEQSGWVSKAAIEYVADMLDMPYIRVLEVATFYTQFQLKPVGTRAHIQVCGTTPCMLRGSEDLMDVCRSRIHHDQFHLNASGTLSWEEVECLGACVNAPMVMVFKDTYEDLTPQRLAEIIDAFEAGLPPTPGPQVERVFSAPQKGPTSLRDERDVLKASGEAASQAVVSDATAEPTVAPSNAARPKTYAPETNAALKSPSRVKSTLAAEKASSAPAPVHDGRAANAAEPVVEGTVKPRKAKAKAAVPPPADYKAPELLQGRALGPGGQRQPEDGAAPVGKPSPDGLLAGENNQRPPAKSRRAPAAPRKDGAD